MSAHTAGPWAVDDKFTVYSTKTLQSVARVQPEPEQEANARLIAAAPELLAVVQLALSRADSELRMMSLNAHGSVEHQSLSTFANKCAAALSAAGVPFSRYQE